MFIPEYRKIQQNGKTVVPQSSDHHLVRNFVAQMEERGLTCFCAFLDRNKARENEQIIMDEKRQQVEMGLKPDEEEFIIEDRNIQQPGLVDWSNDFFNEDMMEVVMSYLSHMPKRSRLKFISMLSTMVMNEVIYAEPVFVDDEEYDEMADLSDEELDDLLDDEDGEDDEDDLGLGEWKDDDDEEDD